MDTSRLRKQLIERVKSGFDCIRPPKSPNSDEADDKFPILDLPLEIISRIVEEVDFATRIVLRRTCRVLSHAETIARFRMEELALYRTADDEFTLSVKHKNSENYLFWQCLKGVTVTKWKDDDFFSRSHMCKESRNTPFQRDPTPLGDLEPVLLKHLRRADIDTVMIDGFHCSDESMPQLTALLLDKSIGYLSLISPFTTTSDAGLYDLLHSCDTLTRLTLAIHRCTEKATVVDRNCLLLATCLLERLCIHARALRATRHSEDKTEVTDALLIKMLSGKCLRLQLLYFTPLLTARGVHAAIKHIMARNLPRVGFVVYLIATHSNSLLRLLGLLVEGGIVSSEDKENVIEQNDEGVTVYFGTELRVAVLAPLFEYQKIIVETTQMTFDPAFFHRMM
ncbi:hypothetical protein PFISCL1PPCAC_17825 [Pristionchus fissidentatus]|uniref:F-box domain-containing protein n=1 Tax=Pristionchus fissidentatus TaxID=1538716 RepID=A0AAV5W733_9BILA|nr:hypothetical protein PFISCL1PPCAC_17825 [Pristionchus fissidentatus]